MLMIVLLVLAGFVTFRVIKNPSEAVVLGVPVVGGVVLGGLLTYFDLLMERNYWQYGTLVGGLAGLIVGMAIINQRELKKKKGEAEKPKA
ncbi:MAG: hypothetical protein KC561_05460 [Myxococcales bacterium]|nr:hypothetical protein [Myxococcales bacterium]